MRIIRGSGCALGDDHSSICAVGPRVMGGISGWCVQSMVCMVYGWIWCMDMDDMVVYGYGYIVRVYIVWMIMIIIGTDGDGDY